MDAEYANYYTREVMLILIREFQSPDEEMKKIVLKVVKQCCSTDGVEAQYIKDDILPHFFKHFWNHRMPPAGLGEAGVLARHAALHVVRARDLAVELEEADERDDLQLRVQRDRVPLLRRRAGD